MGTRSIQACSIWIGSSKVDDAKQSRFDDLSEEQLAEKDGIGIVYMPLVPNAAVPGWDPATISTWRREMDVAETEKLFEVAKVCVFWSMWTDTDQSFADESQRG